MYQNTVSVCVPSRKATGGLVEVSTRWGGDELKKLSDAVIADAATSAVLASVPTAVLRAELRLAAVSVESAPMAKLPAGSGVLLDAVNSIFSDVPSGSVNVNVNLSPSLGLVAPRSTDISSGSPGAGDAGPVTVAFASVVVTALSLRPNGDPAASSPMVTDVGVGELITVRPRPVVPSACARSSISCVNPARVPLPLSMTSAGSVAGVSVARPENR